MEDILAEMLGCWAVGLFRGMIPLNPRSLREPWGVQLGIQSSIGWDIPTSMVKYDPLIHGTAHQVGRNYDNNMLLTKSEDVNSLSIA